MREMQKKNVISFHFKTKVTSLIVNDKDLFLCVKENSWDLIF